MNRLIEFIKKESTRLIFGLSFFAVGLLLLFVYKLSDVYAFALLSDLANIITLAIAGIPVFYDAITGLFRRDFLGEKFLMSIASVGAIVIGDMTEGIAVMLFFLVGEFFEHKAVARSRKSIKSLMQIRPDEATVITDSGEECVDAEDVEVGSQIIIRAGERVPIDSVITEGTADLDTSALTGESEPRAVSVGMNIESGTVVLNGVLKCKTLKLAEESSAARILELVENANEAKSQEEKFITKFSRVYTPIVVILAVLLAAALPLIWRVPVSDALYRSLSFLVISCPCALVISVPMAFFGGIGGAAGKGILFKGGNVFAPLSKAKKYCFDKTGTLTTAGFKISKTAPVGISEDKLLYYSASAEYGSNHPIAQCVKNAVNNAQKPDDYTEIAGRGVIATVDGKRVIAGNLKHLKEAGVTLPEVDRSAALYIALENVYIGAIYVEDEIKKEAESIVPKLKRLGASTTVMLSGDVYSKAEAVADKVGIDEVRAELLPEEKYKFIGEFSNEPGGVVYVGDGINDAPALAGATVGVAMGAIGSDSAIEAADVVIMSDDLSRLPMAVRIARKSLRIAKQNIIFALGIKGAILLLSAFGLSFMWLAIFADVGVAVIAILNSMRALKVGK